MGQTSNVYVNWNSPEMSFKSVQIKYFYFLPIHHYVYLCLKLPPRPPPPRKIIFNISKPEGKIRVYRIPEMKSEKNHLISGERYCIPSLTALVYCIQRPWISKSVDSLMRRKKFKKRRCSDYLHKLIKAICGPRVYFSSYFLVGFG